MNSVLSSNLFLCSKYISIYIVIHDIDMIICTICTINNTINNTIWYH